MQRLSAAAAGLAILALAPAAARAAPSEVRTGEPFEGPVLAGDRALWAEPRRRGGFDLRTAAAAARASTLRSFPEGAPDLAARLAMSVSIFDSQGRAFERDVRTAAIGAGFEVLDEGCGAPASFIRSVDVSDKAVAYLRCGEAGLAAVVRDYSGSASVEQQIPQPLSSGLRVAGRYVAGLEKSADELYVVSAIVVYDRFSGELVYRLPEEVVRHGVHSLDLQDDGKVAFSYAAGGGQQIAWASVAEPYAHVLPLPRRDKYVVAVAGDRIGYLGSRSNWEGYIAPADVSVSDLAGTSRRVGRGAEGSFFNENFDFDGDRATWWSYGCRTARVHIIEVDEPPALSAPRSGCALRFTRDPRVRRGRVRLAIDCFGFIAGSCRARRVRISAGDRVLARGPSGGRVRLSRDGRRLMSTRRSVRVRVRAVLVDDSGRREPRAGRATLRR
jgi:hypothetical protein